MTTAINTYMQNLRSSGRGTKLTREGEVLLMGRIRSGDEEARLEMVEANLRLVVAIAKRYTSDHFTLLDLMQEGNIGLMKAIDKFDYKRGIKFSSYAYRWIGQAIGRALQNRSHTVRLPVHVSEELAKLRRIVRMLTNMNGEEPCTTDVADFLEIPVEKISKMMELSKSPLSLESPGPNASSRSVTLADVVEDTLVEHPSDNIEESESEMQIRSILKSLPSREESVLRMRFGE